MITEGEFLKNRHDFFLNILREDFIVDIKIILKSWEKEFFDTPFNSKKYCAVVVWGEIFDTKSANNLIQKNAIFVPMSDCIHTKKLVWWFRIRNFKTICFSKQLADTLLKHGFRLSNFYYVEKTEEKIINLPKNLSEVRPLNVYIDDKITLKNEHIINKIFKFQKYKIHEKIKDNTHVYLSLKKYSGLDREFIKAISKGIIPIVPNSHNLNDYVLHNKTGYIYRYDLPLYIDFSNIKETQENLIKFNNINHVKWKVKSKKIAKFIKEKNHSPLD
ncbi:hypothetical protein IKA15_00175 [bacterium]|nr:hypothetical protein [bacterium]